MTRIFFRELSAQELDDRLALIAMTGSLRIGLSSNRLRGRGPAEEPVDAEEEKDEPLQVPHL